MCGIFAYVGHRHIPITKAIQVLGILENEQEPGELTPVGGHGAGIAYLNSENKFTLVKVGKTRKDSPVRDLKQQLPNLVKIRSRAILAHVRHASPEFTDTIRQRECTQPYKPHCKQHDLNLVSAHNGYLKNYQQLKIQLKPKHQFESEPVRLIDSEIIPHIYEEKLAKTKNPTKAAHMLYEEAQGRNTIAIMHTNADTNQAHLDIIQKGKTRGLTIWTNPDNAVLLCSREKPLQAAFSKFLKENKYHRIVHLTRNDAANLEAHFTEAVNQHTSVTLTNIKRHA
jgi:glucosamine 6-phosphate synthetase-like amidotransferase/phosphosugar isomerase protein